MAAPRAYPVLTEAQVTKFWQKVDRKTAGECWPWISKAKKGRGYGALTVNKQPLSAHRVAWELAHGPIEPRLVVYQAFCNDPSCCNPAHMAVGTKSDSMHSASRHGAKLGRANHAPKPAKKKSQVAGPYPRLTAKQLENFWLKVDKKSSPHGCWLWVAGNTAGYGIFRAFDRGLRASRLSYSILYGDPPVDMDVCHNCPGGDNPLCVNPSHLFLGTRSQNMKDCVAKGRKNAAKGRLAGKTKLSPVQVYDARKRYDDGEPVVQIACRYGVSTPAISDIGLRKSWKHLPEKINADMA